jgi:ribosomal protein S18 acetylase RimI-like enzyme
MDYIIRPLTSADESLLREMLYQALSTSEAPPPRDILKRPEFARYVEAWGRAGDGGFVARDAKNNEFLGAVWTRFFSRERDAIPELAFVVKTGHRRRGIGAALLTQLVKANPNQSTISVRAPKNNPAVHLYERFGFKVVRETPDSVTMRREA